MRSKEEIKERDIKKLEKIVEEMSKLTARMQKYNPEAHIVCFDGTLYIAPQEMKYDHVPSGFCAPGYGFQDRDAYENALLGGFDVRHLVTIT